MSVPVIEYHRLASVAGAPQSGPLMSVSSVSVVASVVSIVAVKPIVTVSIPA